ncbi:MAG: helix-turn-helix transcriptional regulator [archaeon]
MKGSQLKKSSEDILDVNKTEAELFKELLAKVPDDVSRLVDKQMAISVAVSDAIEKSNFKNRKAFAEAIGMKESMLSRILAGNVNLTLKTITKMESALNTNIISVKSFKLDSEHQVKSQSGLGKKVSIYNSGEAAIPSIASEDKANYSK